MCTDTPDIDALGLATCNLRRHHPEIRFLSSQVRHLILSKAYYTHTEWTVSDWKLLAVTAAGHPLLFVEMRDFFFFFFCLGEARGWMSGSEAGLLIGVCLVCLLRNTEQLALLPTEMRQVWLAGKQPV